MHLLHPLPISGGSTLNQILQPVGSANLPNVHYTNAFSSRVGGITGYEGAGGSVAALAGNPGFKLAMKGGSTFMRRAGGGSKSRRRGSRRCKCKKSCKCRSRRCTCNKSCKCSKSCACRSRRTMRGGANLPYQQYMGGQPNSPNFSVGSNAPLQNSAMANPPPITVRTGCGGK